MPKKIQATAINAAVAVELGVSANSLRTWRDRALGNGSGASAFGLRRSGLRPGPVADAAGEIRRLQREVEYLRRQREILKKGREHTLGGAAERYALIDTMRSNYTISELCDALGVYRNRGNRW